MAQRSLLTRALWFVLVGWWVTPILVNVAWLLQVTIIGIPLGIKATNLVPTALTLKEPRSVTDDAAQADQHSLPTRAIYFVLVGWWAGLIWANVAAFLSVTIIGLPIAIWMFNRLPYVTSLYKFDA